MTAAFSASFCENETDESEMKPHKATSLFPVQTHNQDSVKLGERFTRFTVNLGVICFTLHIILGQGDDPMICTRSVKDIAAKIRPVL